MSVGIGKGDGAIFATVGKEFFPGVGIRNYQGGAGGPTPPAVRSSDYSAFLGNVRFRLGLAAAEIYFCRP
jgi:hypothetical protein